MKHSYANQKQLIVKHKWESHHEPSDIMSQQTTAGGRTKFSYPVLSLHSTFEPHCISLFDYVPTENSCYMSAFIDTVRAIMLLLYGKCVDKGVKY